MSASTIRRRTRADENSARLAAVGGIASLASFLLAGTGQAAAAPHAHSLWHDSAAGVVFVLVQTDAVARNMIAVYDRSDDGTLRPAGTYPTGGLGGALTGSVVDHLASQGALAYDRANGLLYAVNAGSYTIAVFSVYGDRAHAAADPPRQRRVPEPAVSSRLRSTRPELALRQY